jgi:hypothetical protein
MSVKDVQRNTEANESDALAERIRQSMIAVENIRAEKVRLTEQLKVLEHANLSLESEVESLKLAVENERTERRHYRSLANEIVTRLDVVGQTIDEVVKRADQEVYRQRRENPHAELPDIRVPSFLRKVEATLMNSSDEEARAVTQ